MNHTVSKQYHQEIEEFITSLSQKYEEHQKSNSEKTSFNIKPQPSSIQLEENDHSGSETVKKSKEAFCVVGSVQYFKNFCLDKLGQPLLNENPQLTDGWDIPKYQQVFTQIVSLDGQEIQVKSKRPKPCCFNCGSEEHQMRDCPKPRDQAHITKKRKEFMDACGEAGNQNQQRYHAEGVEERFGKYKPGVISEELQEALGITEKNFPPFIYRMRELGYPPGWLKEAELENSGLALYDGKDTSDGEIEERDTEGKKHVSYDVSKLVNYPGFNISAPPGMFDDWQMFGSIPMQPAHQKDIFATYLTTTFPSQSPNNSNKRSACQSSSSERKRQKTSGNHTVTSAVDMDMESDEEMYRSRHLKGYTFQPPLPPGSPSYGTPPPLPRGTPPSTPPNFIPPPPPTPTPPPLPKGTPPPTPNRDSPKVPPQVLDEDTWTLEELEEKQRLLWAQLDNAESTNSDCDAHTPITGSSVTSSPSRTDLDIVTRCKAASQQPANEFKTPCGISKSFVPESEEASLLITEEDSEANEDSNECYVAEGNDIEEHKLSPNHEKTSEKNQADEYATEEAACVEPSPKMSGVPDMSKFAEGITPFEYDNMSDSTGVYLRLRSVLKNSPRNQQKSKKQV
ncbi:zinc finger CCHC domain-containing protein 8 isoform X1 [Xenopus tropicalis]|nr:zinc finger CCHC domain-containing protein 8 isoform X1 [Xenopus tropicalis]|eukprot:XP_012812909.1 PREDICTED: zinc finger CCHC domain-containing protein 8 isoform X1 [Xenopus tropicalis]